MCLCVSLSTSEKVNQFSRNSVQYVIVDTQKLELFYVLQSVVTTCHICVTYKLRQRHYDPLIMYGNNIRKKYESFVNVILYV